MVGILIGEINVVVLQQQAKKCLPSPPWIPTASRSVAWNGRHFLAMATTNTTAQRGFWTSNGPHTGTISQPSPCMCLKDVVGLRELESPTSSVSRKRSNQLSYRPKNLQEN